MRTRKELSEKIAELQKELQLVETLVAFGVPEKYAIYFEMPHRYSDYSMGEVDIVEDKAGNVLTKDTSYLKYYSGKYAGRETHGKSVFTFTKKTLTDYCRALYNARKSKAKPFSDEFMALHNEVDKIKNNAFNKNKSIHKK